MIPKPMEDLGDELLQLPWTHTGVVNSELQSAFMKTFLKSKIISSLAGVAAIGSGRLWVLPLELSRSAH